MALGLEGRLVQTCNKIAKSYNARGDIVYGAVTSDVPCLYRDQSELLVGNGNREEVKIDGIFWFYPDSGFERGDIIEFEGEYFRIDRIIKARRRLRGNALKFIKAQVMRQRQVS